jgi:hypothetical protein
LNGALLASADYTATDGTSVVLAAGAAANDIFTALAYDSATQITQGDTTVEVTDSGTGKIEFTVDNVEVADFTTGEVVFNETGANQDFRVEGDTNANLLVADAGVDKVGIGTNTFNTNGGVLQVSNGISFPATQSACSDANTLDDYEEGTWTVQFFDAEPTGGNASPTTGTGYYTKIGRVVYCVLPEISNISTSGMTSGNFFNMTLPFSASSVGYAAGVVNLNGITLPSSGVGVSVIMPPSGARTYFRADTNTGGATIKVSDISSGTTDITQCAFFYFV